MWNCGLEFFTPSANDADEQADARERRSQADLKWSINRRRPVIGDVRRHIREFMTSHPTSFIDRYRDLGLAGRPMDAASIASLEEHLGLPIPAAYRAYLAIAGELPPPELIGSDCHAENLFKLHDWAIELLNESGDPFPLPDNAIVFLMHQGYQFFYIYADGITDDPPVYYYLENRPQAERHYERFSDWVAAIT